MKFNNIQLTKRKLVLCLAVVIATTCVIAAILLIPTYKQQAQEAAREAALDAGVSAQAEAYSKPIAATQQLSQVPAEKQQAFLSNAAAYYGMPATHPDGTPPSGIEIVGACIRDKNFELARIYIGQSDEAVAAHDAEIKEVRQKIAADCYARYSPDGKVPEAFSREKHNH